MKQRLLKWLISNGFHLILYVYVALTSIYSIWTVYSLVPQNRIERRALSLDDKECYTWQEIEYIVFGEIQE